MPPYKVPVFAGKGKTAIIYSHPNSQKTRIAPKSNHHVSRSLMRLAKAASAVVEDAMVYLTFSLARKSGEERGEL